MFLQIHTLTSFPASLLNRDDAGLAKRIPFGDGTRLRVSSQCMKRHWREAMQRSLDLPSGIRSREFFSRVVFHRLVEEKRIDEQLAHILTATLVKTLVKGGVDGDDPLSMKQPALFGKPEADFFVEILAACATAGDESAGLAQLADKLKETKKNYKAMLKQAGHGHLFAGFEGALFGRFVTSDILARSDAAVHVAHPITVHPMNTEIDYFTVVDDLNKDDETGAAHAGDMELGAGLFYGYVVVDIPLLVSNFSGCDPADWASQDSDDAETALRALLESIATVSPGAKLGATAPYARAELVFLEAGAHQPRTLANAWLEAQVLTSGEDPMQQAVDRLGKHVQALDTMYGETAGSRFAATTKRSDSLNNVSMTSFPDAIDQILGVIFGE